jgi:integrase/recombinase XerD
VKRYDPDNERIKRKYFTYLKEAMRQNETSLDAAAKALNRFEQYTRFRNFKSFHHKQAISFKNNLAKTRNQKTGKLLSKATLNTTLSHLKRFFHWLAGQPGYKSRIQYSDAEYFNLSKKDARIATAKRERPTPTIEQICHVLGKMPENTELERRNRALIAFVLLTGARDSAVATFKIKHIDLVSKCICQDARDVKTKYSKTFTTYFFPVGQDIVEIVEEWVKFLTTEKFWAGDDPLFPSTLVGIGDNQRFESLGLSRNHWRSAGPIRKIFQDAFRNANLPYYNPHSFRNTLARLGETVCRTPEEFKAWSQNLGHEGVLTTFQSYGTVPNRRQSEIILNLSDERIEDAISADKLADAVVRKLKGLNSLIN